MPNDDFKVSIQAEIDEASLSAIQQRIKDLGKNSKTKVTFDDGGSASKTAKDIKNIDSAAKSASSSSKTLGTALKQAFGIGTAVTAVVTTIRTLTNVAKEAVTQVKELDSALTQLSVVTGAEGQVLNNYLQESISLAKELGQEVTDVISSIETFARLGYSFNDSSELSKFASILSNIADTSLDEATTGLTSILKGYSLDVSDAEHVADVLTKVGASYAVSTSEIMTSLEKGGAALSASGTNLEESIALVAAGNAAIQDASTVGTALKSVSARIRGATTELEELGESTEGLADGFSKYANELQSLTGFSILEEGTTNEYKDIYEIFDGISQCWDDLSDTAQARVAEILGGTRQLSVISSILTNWSDATGAYEDAMNASGTATQANEVYMDSLEAKVSQLHASLTELASDTIPTDFLKGAVDAGDSIVQLLDNTNLLQVALAGLATFGAGKGLSALATGFENAITRMSDFGNAMTLLSQTTAIGVDDFSDLLIMTQGLSASQIEAVVSSAALTTEQKIAIITNSTLSKSEKEAAIGAVELSAAEGTATATTASLSATVKGLAASLGMTTTAFLALVAGVAAVTAALVAFNYSQHEYTRALEAAEEATQSYADMKSDLESLEEEYASIKSQIEELIALQTDGSITLEQETELENLQAQSEELERQIELQTTLAELQQEAADAAVQVAANTEQSYLESMQAEYGKILGMIEALSGYIGGSEVDGKYQSDAQQWNSKDTSVNGLAQESIEQLREYQQEYEAVQEQIYNSENATQASVWENRKTEIAGYIEDETERLTGYAETLQAWIDQYTDEAGNVTEGYEDSVAEWQATLNDIATIDMSDLEKQVYEIETFLSANDDEDNSISNALSSAVENGEDLQSVLDGLGISLSDIGDDIGIDTLEKYFNSASESAETAITNIHELADSLEIDLSTIIPDTNPIDYTNLTVPDDTIQSWGNLQSAINAYNDGSTQISEGLKDTFDDSAFGSSINSYIQDVNKLTDAFTELRDGDFSNDDIEKLCKQFPELDKDAGDLEGQIKSLLSSMRTNVINEFSSQFDKVDSDEATEQLQIFEDAVLELGRVVGSTEFSIDIEAETEGMENLWTAMSESVSSTGLTADSITNLKERYQDLENYDAAALFERTENGIHLNTKALRELEAEYENQMKQGYDDQLDYLESQYNDLTQEINNASNAASTADLYAQRSDILSQIEEVQEAAAQYDGLTSAFYKWEQAQSIGEEGDMYDSLAGGLENIKELYDEGLVGTNEFRAAVQLMSNEDLSTASVDELLNAYESGYSKMTRYFQDSSDGCLNFLQDVEKLNSEWVHMNEDGSWEINFGMGNDQEIADALGINVESVQSILRKLSDYGFDINLDSAYSSLELLESDAEEARDKLLELGKTDVVFNFETDDIDYLNEQIGQASDLLDTFKSEDGSVDLSLEGAEEAQIVLANLISQKQSLSQPEIMSIDTTALDNADEDIINGIALLQEFISYSQDLEVEVATGTDTTETQQKLQDVISKIDALPDETAVALGINDEGFQTTLDSVVAQISEGAEADVAVTVSDEDIATIQSTISGIQVDDLQLDTNSEEVTGELTTIDEFSIDDKTFSVTAHDYASTKLQTIKSNLDKIKSKTVTITEVTKSVSKLSGTAHLEGTAYAGGKSGSINPNLNIKDSWRTKQDEIALTGEEGQEIVATRDGYWYTVGDHGASFENIPAGSVIFDAQQTKTLLSTGKINSRGRSWLSGTAYSSGVGTITASGKVKTTASGSSKSSSSSSSSASDDAENFAENLDWIDTLLTRIEESIDRISVTADSTYKTLSTRNSALTKEISLITSEINTQEQAYTAYMNAANAVNLSDYYKNLVKNGAINFETITDESLADAISEFQELYEKAIECQDSVAELREEISSLYEQKFDNIATDFDNQLSSLEHYLNTLEIDLSTAGEKGYSIGSTYYHAMIDTEAKSIDLLNQELTALNASLNEGLRSGAIEAYSEAFWDMQQEIYSVTEAIDEAEAAIHDYYEEYFDYVANKFDSLISTVEYYQSMINESISQAEASGYIVSTKYYEALIEQEQQNISKLEQEKEALTDALSEAVQSGAIQEYSDAWFDMCDSINEVSLAISQATTSLIEYNNEIQEIEWSVFDLIQDRIENITDETDFLINLLGSADLYDDKGQFTDAGWATVALHAENMNIDYANAEAYYKEMQELQEQIADDPYNETLINRYDELSEKRMEAIADAESEKESIISLVEDGIQLEIDAFNDLISEIESAVDAEKSLYDYSIKVQDAVDEISSIQKILSSLENDTSESAKSSIQSYRQQLSEAEQSLESLEYDQYISDLRSILDNLSLEYETVLNMRLDDVTSLISDLTGYINDNSNTIYQTLLDTSESVGYTLSAEMESIWGSGGTVLTTMSANITNGISSATTTINSTLGTINTNISKMISQLDKLASTQAAAATASSATTSTSVASTSATSTASTSSSSSSTSNSTSSSSSSNSSSSSSSWGSFFVHKTDSYPKSKLNVDTSIVDRLKYFDFASSFANRRNYYVAMGLGSSYIGSASQNTAMIAEMKKHNFAEGGTIGDLISKTGEDGFILARSGEEVLSLKKIEALGEVFTQMNPVLDTLTDLNNVLPDFSDVTTGNNNSTVTNEFQLDFTLPNVTNADEFMNELVTNKKFEQAIQAMTVDRLSGGSSLKKYKYRS